MTTTAASGAPAVAEAAIGAAIGPVAPTLDAARPPATHWYAKLCRALSLASLGVAIVMLLGVIVCVQYQVVGRYIFNDTPTWAESLALLLVLYVTALGVAVGVRDAGHIGLESIVSLLPDAWRLRVELLIHAFVVLFGALMAWSGWVWTRLKWTDIKPMLGVPVSADYLSLAIAGVLIVIFSIEHIVALLRGEEVTATWS